MIINSFEVLDLIEKIMSDPRISDQELARINAAAVTKEYRVQPHLGTPRFRFLTDDF